MATVKVKFRPSYAATREGSIFYRVIHNRTTRHVHTGYKVYPCEWNAECSKIVLSPNTEESRYEYLISLKDIIAADTARLNRIISRLERTAYGDFTADMIIDIFKSSDNNDSFIVFANQLITELKIAGKRRTAETYSASVNSISRFHGNDDISFDDMNSNLIMRYESYLKSSGLCPNSTSFYMRNLRAIYNRAVEKQLTEQRHPFKRVYTGIDKTIKRAVPLKIIRKIRDLDFKVDPAMDYARNIFMFSFYTRGMSFIDMAYLRKNDLKDGILSYRRRKTGQQLFIKWEKPMQQIVSKYDTSGSPYLLPIIRNIAADDRQQYKNAAHKVNIYLKRLGRQIGLSMPLTSYVARHAWASIAKSKNIPVSVISEAMGHDSESTTRIYLASLDTSAVDKANRMIIKLL